MRRKTANYFHALKQPAASSGSAEFRFDRNSWKKAEAVASPASVQPAKAPQLASAVRVITSPAVPANPGFPLRVSREASAAQPDATACSHKSLRVGAPLDSTSFAYVPGLL